MMSGTGKDMEMHRHSRRGRDTAGTDQQGLDSSASRTRMSPFGLRRSPRPLPPRKGVGSRDNGPGAGSASPLSPRAFPRARLETGAGLLAQARPPRTGKGPAAPLLPGINRYRFRSLTAVPCALLLALLLLFGTARPARALELRAWVDKTEATIEDQILLTVSVAGQRRLPADLKLPPLPDFSVSRGGTSSRTEIINGSIRTSVEVTYLLVPRHIGIFTIGPVTLSRNGRTYRSQPIQVKILPASGSTGERPAAFVTQEVDVTAPFVHQQVLYTFRFYRRVQAAEAQWDPPSFEGFWVEDLGKERQYEKIIGGQRYDVTEVRKALSPLSPGTKRIDQSVLTCRLLVPTGRSPGGFDSLFDQGFFPGSIFGGRSRAVTKNLHADPLTLRVRPLPEAGRPKGFSGLVGSFSIRAEVGQEHLQAGDSTTLTVTITGRGNLRDLLEPSSAGPFTGFKVYADKPTYRLEVEGTGVRGTKVFKKALVPLKAGVLEIPAQEVHYFDPEAGAYKTAATAPIRLTVEKGEETEPLHLVTAGPSLGSRQTVKILGKDILPIHTGLAAASQVLPRGTLLALYLAAFLFPPPLFFLLNGRKKRRERLETHRHILRRKAARKEATRRLKEARRLIRGPGEEEAFFRLLTHAVKGLVGDKLNLSALAYTPTEIRRHLVEKGVEEQEARRIEAFLEELEFHQYASSGTEPKQRGERYRTAKRLVARLDRAL